MQSKKIILFAFLALSTSWATTQEGTEPLAFDYFNQNNWINIFDFSSPSDILNFMLTQKYEKQISEEACEACSKQLLSIINRNIHLGFLYDIKKS